MKRQMTVALLGPVLIAICSLGWAQMIDRTDSRVQTTLKTGWKCLGTIQPRSVGEIDAGQNWTLGCETLCRDYIYWDTYKDYVAPLGIKTIRLQGGWAKTEKVQGVYDFAWLDYVIDDALAKGLEIWLETDYGNPIYEGAGTADLGAGFPTSEVGLAAWDRWVEALATRYKDRASKWAMWNEPDIGVKKTPEMIANFNIRTAEIIKRIIPDARIGALSLARIDPTYLDACLKVIADQGKLNLFEWVIYHGYTKNPDDAYKNVEAMKAVVGKYEPHLENVAGRKRLSLRAGVEVRPVRTRLVGADPGEMEHPPDARRFGARLHLVGLYHLRFRPRRTGNQPQGPAEDQRQAEPGQGQDGLLCRSKRRRGVR